MDNNEMKQADAKEHAMRNEHVYEINKLDANDGRGEWVKESFSSVEKATAHTATLNCWCSIYKCRPIRGRWDRKMIKTLNTGNAP